MKFAQPALNRRLIAYTGLGFVGIVVLLLGSLWLTRRVESSADLALRARQVAEASTVALASVRSAESAQRGFLLTNDERYLEPLQRTIGDLPHQMSALRQLLRDEPDQLARLAEAQDRIDRKIAEMTSTVALAKAGKRAAAVSVVNSDRGLKEMLEVRDLLLTIRNNEDNRFAVRRRALSDANRTLFIVDFAAALLVVAMAWASLLIMTRSTRSLQETGAELDKLNRGLEATVKERTREIVRKTEEVQRFAYIVSHDLRAPLVNIMGFTRELENAAEIMDRQLLAVQEKAPDLVDQAALETVRRDVPEAVSFIRSSSEKMDRLIRAVLALAREGQRPLTLESIDMNEMVGGIVASLHQQLKDANAEIEVEKLPAIESDRLTIEQSFSNLLDNAVKYLDPARPGRIRVTGEERPHVYHFEISDNGRGVPERDQERIFELFRRAGDARDKPGEGLGLAFVQASIQRLSGAISLQSVHGEGSTFTLEIPRNSVLSKRRKT